MLSLPAGRQGLTPSASLRASSERHFLPRLKGGAVPSIGSILELAEKERYSQVHQVPEDYMRMPGQGR